MPDFIEVSHVIEAGMETYRGLPKPLPVVVREYDDTLGAAEFFIASLHLCGNTGTYVDSPVHRFRGGADLASLPLDRLAHVPAVVVDATRSAERGITQDAFRELDLRDRAVLVRTDWSCFWNSSHYFEPHPFLTAGACDFLLDAGVRFVGIDSLNIDDTQDPERPAHTKLLAAGIPICEHMTNLAAVPAEGGFLHAVPIAWKGGASFPVRAYVIRGC